MVRPPAATDDGGVRRRALAEVTCADESGAMRDCPIERAYMEKVEVDWSALPDDLVRSVRQIADGDNYDEAIFAAFKHVEAEIQGRLGSRSVGAALIAEAFDGTPPKIIIGTPGDQASVRAIFAGALGFIRNDRGHKKTPAVPCRSMKACMWFLNHAALLLYLLSKDEALRARVDSISVAADRLQFHGVNLQHANIVKAADVHAQILQVSECLVEALLPSAFVGQVELYSDGELIDQRYCDARNLYGVYPAVYEVIDVELPLFTDSAGGSTRSEYVGVLLRLYESGKVYNRVSPTTRGRYKKGQFVRAAPWDMTVAVGETWYRDSISGEIRYAWTSSALFVPDELSCAPAPQLSAVIGLPTSVSLEPGEVITLTVRGIESIGDARREIDLTEHATWKSADSNVAYVNRGVLYAKRFGNTTLLCSAKGFQAAVAVAVENHARGDCSVHFEGLRLTGQICFDVDDDLYITNQSQRIYRLRRKGGLEVALQMPNAGGTGCLIDYLTLNARGLYFTALHPRRVMFFPRDGTGFGVGQWLGSDDGATKKSIAIAADSRIVVGLMGGIPGTGHVLQIHPDGRETTFSARESAHNLALGPDGNIYVVAASRHMVDVYDPFGSLLDSIDYGSAGSVGAIMVGGDLSVFVSLFSSGELIRVKRLLGRVERSILATDLGNPCGISMDSLKRLYVSDFSTGRIYVLR
jgi:hypothetical protein